jgi:hypothetical protein
MRVGKVVEAQVMQNYSYPDDPLFAVGSRPKGCTAAGRGAGVDTACGTLKSMATKSQTTETWPSKLVKFFTYLITYTTFIFTIAIVN